jgi:hypothetical protein
MNIFKRFVEGTPDQRAKFCPNVFLGTCGSESSDEWRRVCRSVFSSGVDGPLDAESWRSYRVSGTKKMMESNVSAVGITAIHLCQRQLRLDTMKPQIKGPMVLPPAIAFLGRC